MDRAKFRCTCKPVAFQVLSFGSKQWLDPIVMQISFSKMQEKEHSKTFQFCIEFVGSDFNYFSN
jgi:hypothetical protein